MAMMEQQAAEEYELSHPSRKNPAKKRRIRPVPLTSKIPLYDKLMAEKEERYIYAPALAAAETML